MSFHYATLSIYWHTLVINGTADITGHLHCTPDTVRRHSAGGFHYYAISPRWLIRHYHATHQVQRRPPLPLRHAAIAAAPRCRYYAAEYYESCRR